MMRSLITVILLILFTGNSWGQVPPKYQLGSQENPYYTISQDNVTLRQYFDTCHNDLEKSIGLRFKALEQSIDSARQDMERRMKDFPEQFVKKGEVGEILSKLTSKVELLEKANNQLEGKASSQALEIVRWVSIAGILLSIIGILLRFFKV